jgi:microsomal dipeptidase-like Zn-dependent dipeptidase
VGLLSGGSLEGEYCQNHGLTPLGEFLMSEMMKRGMVMEVDHFSRRSYKRAYEILVENEYPAVGTHGRDYNGLLYELGGVSTSGFGRCRNPEVAATTDDSFQRRLALMKEKNAYPGLGFGFDLNGFAGYPKPRFGELANCSQPQSDPITYPFKSFAGDITLEQPLVGERVLDFNTEGMVHLGLVAEYIEEVRRDGVSDEALEPLFRSAEGYIRVWETSERRALEMRQ